MNDHEFSEVLKLVRDRFDSLDRRMDRQDKTLANLLEEAKRTNGRVNTLERKDAVSDATAQQVAKQLARRHSWRVTLISALVAAICGSGVGSLILIFGGH